MTLFDACGGVRHADPETSRLAAADPANRLRWGSQRHRLLDVYRMGREGRWVFNFTDEEAGVFVALNQIQATRRCSELRKAGWIEPVGVDALASGNLGMTCRITDAGRAALRAAEGKR